jgi:hypothetical protein
VESGGSSEIVARGDVRARKDWREIGRKEGNKQLNSPHFAAIFVVAGGGERRFIRLVDSGRNHWGIHSMVSDPRHIIMSDRHHTIGFGVIEVIA